MRLNEFRIIILLIIGSTILFSCGTKPSQENYQQVKSEAIRYANQGRCDKTIDIGRDLLKINEKDSEVYRVIAECFEKLDQPDSAVFYYEGAIVFKPSDRKAYERVGDIYFEQGKYHEAMTWYDRALEIGYISPESYIKLARIHQNWNEYIRAKEYYTYALAIDSSIAQALYGLGSVELQIADTSAAVISFKKAVEQGKHAGAAYKLGLIYQAQKQYDKAIEWLDKCAEYSDDPDITEKAYQRKMEIIVKMKAGQG